VVQNDTTRFLTLSIIVCDKVLCNTVNKLTVNFD
jgi:hypothetical protein